jgi:hypothetical protein
MLTNVAEPIDQSHIGGDGHQFCVGREGGHALANIIGIKNVVVVRDDEQIATARTPCTNQ